MGAYDAMRHFADSWGLLGLFLIFGFAVAFVFRKGSRRQYGRAARIPLDDEKRI